MPDALGQLNSPYRVWRFRGLGEDALHPRLRAGVYKGWIYEASLHLETPLKFLVMHGQIDHDMTQEPDCADSAFGHWGPLLKTLREIGVDMDDPPAPHRFGDRHLVSQDYLSFLIAVRTIVESQESVYARRKKLIAELERPSSLRYSHLPGHYQTEICDRHFPTFLSRIEGLPSAVVEAMWDVGLDTPAKIGAATDAQLLEFKGVGPHFLLDVREACSAVTIDRDQPWIDMVTRQ